jgi:hypothetical protein
MGVTGSHEILGTAHYMSPEQASGEPVDARSDLYSLGVTTYFALTSQLPFEGTSPSAVLAKVLTSSAPGVGTSRPDIPARLAEVVDRCLMREPAARYSTGEELAEAVGSAYAAPPEPPPQVRALLNTAQEMDTAVGLLALVGVFALAVPSDLLDLRYFLILVLVFAPIVAFPFALLTSVRRVLQAGLDSDDVRAAIEAVARSRVEVNRAMLEDPKAARRRFGRLARWYLLSAFALVVTAFVLMLVDVVLELDAPLDEIVMRVGVASLLIAVLMVAAVIVGAPIALIVSIVFPRFARRRRPLGLSLRLLQGRLGDWFIRLAGHGLDVREHGGQPSAERTEVLLGDAVAALFEALPSHVRERFHDVPGAVSRLESDARRLRDRESLLDRAIQQAGSSLGLASSRQKATVAELTQARELTRARLTAAVAALESIRLDLLRLQAGVGSVDDLTEDLEKAREINAAVDAELAGRDAVRELTGSRTS